jgi:nitrous oxide reductase accessory protein NosL
LSACWRRRQAIAAADFVAQHGGTLYRFDEIDTALIKQVRRQGIEHLAGH